MRFLMQTVRDFFSDRFSRAIGVLGAISALNSLFFIRAKDALEFFPYLIENPFFCYLAYAIITLSLWIILVLAYRILPWQKMFAAIFLSFFPTALILAYGTAVEAKNIHWVFHLSIGLYVIALGLFLLIRRHRTLPRAMGEKNAENGVRSWARAQGVLALFTIAITMALYCSFGVYYLGKQAIVDEPLWFYERIPRFWRNLGEQDWKGTSVSDKPGITVAMISGIALLNHNPTIEKIAEKNGETERLERLFFALRLPLFLLTALLLPLFYFFIERLLGRTTALIALPFIGLSPPLLGIARIVNPDSLLWIFVPLSLLSYLVFLKEKEKDARHALFYLYATGIFLGLALLTKYVSNIVLAFLFGMLFLEHVLLRRDETHMETMRVTLRESVKNFLSVTFVALATFYILFPAIWIKPKKILDATLTSEAFEPILWPALVCITLLCIDLFLLRARIISAILFLLSRHARILFSAISIALLSGIAVAIANTWLGMSPYDFQSVLASPKSAYVKHGPIALHFAAFYTLAFGIMPLALIGIVAALGTILFRKTVSYTWGDRAAVVIGFFILAYYFGSTATHVGATLRYQIVIFPLALLLSASGIALLLAMIEKRFAFAQKKVLPIVLIFILCAGAFTLLSIKPFYFSYSNFLLPERYILNPKDMGDGSYQIAHYLNAKADASDLTIWSDKNGVCAFFVGRCKSGLDFKGIITNGYTFDYYVVSKGREARTTTLVGLKERHNATYVLPFDELYRIDPPEFMIAPGGHDANYIKVIDARTVTVTQ